MGYKKVCFKCKKAFNRNFELKKTYESTCSDCGGEIKDLYHLFKPPRRSELKKWNVVKFLFENGFIYHSIYENPKKHSNSLKYPEKMSDAKEFVLKYESQSLKR